MSQQNVEGVREAMALFNRPRLATDPDTPGSTTEPGQLSEVFVPDVVWDLRTFTGWPDRSQFRGLAELSVVDAWPYHEWSFEVADAGKNRVVVPFHPRDTAQPNDPWVDRPYGIICTMKKGLIQRGQVYATLETALEAAGLQE